LYNLPKVRTQ